MINCSSNNKVLFLINIKLNNIFFSITEYPVIVGSKILHEGECQDENS